MSGNKYIEKVKSLLHLISINKDPRKTALSVVFGFYLGIFPVVGVTTSLCIVASVVFRLDHIIIQLVNWIVFPVQILLIIPFHSAGNILLSKHIPVEVQPISLSGILTNNMTETIHQIFTIATGGLLAWGIFTVATSFFLFQLILPVCRRLNSVFPN